MNSNIEQQRRNNAETRGGWDAFTSHRARVTEILCSLSPGPSARLRVLGAGNCNDLDLKALAHRFAVIELVDLDREAVVDGVRRQEADCLDSIRFTTSCDLTGIAGRISRWRPDCPAPDAEVRECASYARTFSPGFDGLCDVVASVCVLSQLISSVIECIGDRHSHFLDLMTAVREAHLRQVLEATRSGGKALLVADIVSTDSCPQLLSVSPNQLLHVVMAAVDRQNFFTGMNPAILHQLLAGNTKLKPLIASFTVGMPWLWNLGPRGYAVVPFVITRR